MSKNHTFRKIVVATALIGTAMYIANEYIMKIATSKDLLKKDNGEYYSFKYGKVFYRIFLFKKVVNLNSATQDYFVKMRIRVFIICI